MNITDLHADYSYATSVTPRRLIALYEVIDDFIIGDDLLSPAQARAFAERLDAGDSALDPITARKLAESLTRCADRAERLKSLRASELAVYERLMVTDADSMAYPDDDALSVIHRGLIAMNDLILKTGLNQRAIIEALDALRDRAMIKDVLRKPGAAPRIRLFGLN